MNRRRLRRGARSTAWAMLLALLLLPGLAGAQSSQPIDAFWTTNGFTYAILPVGSTVYVGGSFTLVGPYTGTTARFDESGGGAPDPGIPKVDGTVRAVAPDGAGGWYLGGSFTRVGNLPRSNLAHILADGRVASWDPSPDADVRALVVAGPLVYAAGFFTSIGGQPRNRIAALDATTGLATGWDPSANFTVLALAVSGDRVYAGGDFTSIGGQPRNRLAALDTATGLATSWDPNPSSSVFALAVSGDRVYAGGAFTTIGGQPRNHIAAVSTVSGLATAWNPSATGGFQQVFTLAAVDNLVYAGGRFTIIGGQGRNYLAEIDAATGLATSWNPSPNDEVFTLAVSATRVYVGGSFTSVGGQPRYLFGAVERSDGSASPWDPLANRFPYALAVAGGKVFAGGAFTALGNIARSRAAAFDVTTGLPTAWDPDVIPVFANQGIRALAEEGGTIYLGGDIASIGGQPRNLIGAVDATVGAVTSWDPNASGPGLNTMVYALSTQPGVVYAGGDFDTIGGQARNRIAALDTGTGLATAWDPNASSNTVDALVATPGSVYAGGDFLTIGGQTRRDVAEIDAATGLATAWNPGTTSNHVYGLAVTPGEVYMGGTFTTMAGQPRARIAAVDRVTGLATAFDPGANITVRQVAVQGNLAFAAGAFTTFGGQSRSRMAAADRFTGVATSWTPAVNTSAQTVAADTKRVYGGADFPRGNFAVFCLATPPGGLTATPAGSNRVDLDWTANGAPTYRVLRTRTSGGPYDDLGTTASTSFSDTTAEGGVTYYYVIRAIDECESEESAEASATATGPCALPPDFEGAAWVQQPPGGTCSLEVGWGDAVSPCGGSTTYSVHRDTAAAFVPSPGNLIASGLSATTFADPGPLPPGVAQYYVVRALSTVSGLEDTNEIRQSAVPTSCAGAAGDGVRVLGARATEATVRLEWVNPPVGPYASTRIRYSTSGYPTGPNDGLAVTDQAGPLGGADYYEHTGLASLVHYYAAFVDTGSGYSSARFVQARPFGLGTGPVWWAYSTGAAAMAPPGIGTGVIYAPSNDATVHALVDGDLGGEWPPGFVPPALGGPAQARPPVVPTVLIPPASEVLLVGAQDGYAYAVDAQTGAQLWTPAPLLGDVVQAAVAGIFTEYGGSQDFLLVGARNFSSGSEFYALDVASGAPVGSAFDNGGGASAIGAINGMATVDYTADRVYFASRQRVGGSSNTLWALDITGTGVSPAWAVDLGDIDGSPVLRDGRIYVGTNAGEVYSVRTSDGGDWRSFPTNDGPVKGFVFPDRTSNDLFVSTDNHVFILEDNGVSVVSKWPEVTVPGPSIPVFDSIARELFVGGSDGRLYRIDVSGVPSVSSLPLGDGLAGVGAPTLNRIEPALYVGSEAGIIYRVTPPFP